MRNRGRWFKISEELSNEKSWPIVGSNVPGGNRTDY